MPTPSSAELELQKLEQRGPRADPYRPGRTMTMSRHGIVASSNYYASLTGLDMLRSGGNAMDAAIAAAGAIGVCEPMMTGMGGDVFILYYEAKTGKVYALNGSGHSPKNLTREYFDKKEKKEIDSSSWEAVTVPGAVDAWCTALELFGSKKIGEVLAPAIRYAEEGFPVTQTVADDWKDIGADKHKDPWLLKTYLIDGKTPAPGQVFKNPNLGKSLRLVAEGGRDAFYKGPIAEEIVRYAKESGGFLTMEDFAEHWSMAIDPISTNYRGYDVYQCPPNGQGIGVLMMLNILEGFDLKSMKHNSPEYLHLLIEAKKLAYADLYKYVADPEWKGGAKVTPSDKILREMRGRIVTLSPDTKGEVPKLPESEAKRGSRLVPFKSGPGRLVTLQDDATATIPIKGLLSKEYAAKQRARIDIHHAAEKTDPGIPEGSDTIYLCAIDQEGNAVSLINSLYSAFGAKIVGGSTGILLQNRGAGFTLEKGHANEYAPGKRPYHTIIPGMVLKDKKLYMAYGLMGGPMQPQGHVQFLLNHLDFGLTIQEANDVPRWRHNNGLEIRLEHGTPRETMDALRKMGHHVEPAPGGDFGGCQAILVDPATGTYFGASDPRKDGAALGY